MSKKKFLYWDGSSNEEGKSGVSAYILIEYREQTLKNFLEAVEELRQTFPDATDEQISLGRVCLSSFYKGFMIVCYEGDQIKKEYEGWEVRKIIDFFW